MSAKCTDITIYQLPVDVNISPSKSRKAKVVVSSGRAAESTEGRQGKIRFISISTARRRDFIDTFKVWRDFSGLRDIGEFICTE
jgi:hypothetical protein